MNNVLIAFVCGLALIICGMFLYYLRHKWRIASDAHIKVYLSPVDRISAFHGWSILELAVLNRSNVTLWIDRANLILTDIDAQFQTVVPVGHETALIRYALPPGESIPISLNQCLYKAAGNPQGWYSFNLSGAVTYQIEEDWARVTIRPRRIEMTALSIIRLGRQGRKNIVSEPHNVHTKEMSNEKPVTR